MKRLRRLTLFAGLCAIAISTVLLLDFTAPNPTGRRSSSERLDLTLSSQQKGQQGENILSRDLGIPRNDTDGRQCICNDPTRPATRPACNVCIAFVPQLSINRRPDFITDKLIVEVKNHGETLYESRRDMEELRDYATAARELGLPLWVFLRTDTPIEANFEAMIKQTGGGVVQYLATPAYVDEVGRNALLVLAGSTLIVLLSGFREVRSRPHRMKSITIDDTEAFLQRGKDRARVIIETEEGKH